MKTNKFTHIPPLIENSNLVNDSQSKSDIFNNFFASKSSLPDENEEPPTLERKPNITPFSQLNTSPIEVSKLIRSLKKSSFSSCGIPGKLLSEIATPISYPLSIVFNNLFSIGYFPEIWKIAHVTPIYKRSGPKTDKANFRPISLLPTLSKVCEAIMHQRLLSHCIDFNLITEHQAAYLKGDSTVTQLLYLVHSIRSSWNEGKITQGVFLDISSAFDKVWHKGLIAKLMQIGVEDKVLEVFTSYLTNRKQVVVLDGCKSDTVDISAGVPQGSRLGPLLFIIYINDIIDSLENDILIFADDTTLIAKGLDPVETSEKLNRDLAKIEIWANRWKVSFNPKKSKDIIFSNKNLFNSPPILFNQTQVSRVNTHKHLGIYLTSTLDWSLQVSQLCLKANRKLSVLRSIKLLQRKTLDMLYKVTVRSVIDYGLPLYFNNLKQTDILKINRVQYNAAKVVTGALPYTSQEKLEYELGWESIKNRADYLGITIFHKIHLHETRPLVRKCMPSLSPSNNYNIRNNSIYNIFPFFSQKFSNSFFPFYTKVWNGLDKNLLSKGLNDFKCELALKIKPNKYKHFSKGYKFNNILLTRLRVGRSKLNLHSFTIGQSDTIACACGYRQESVSHYFLDCIQYTTQRQILFTLFEQTLPSFKNMSKNNKLNTILYGVHIDDNDYYYVNCKLTYAVQKFIAKTKRFNI